MNAAKRVETWVWVLIYLGMFLFALGLSVQRSSPSVGWTLSAAGIALVTVGVVLIYVRSRLKDGAAGQDPNK